jgi:thermitase
VSAQPALAAAKVVEAQQAPGDRHPVVVAVLATGIDDSIPALGGRLLPGRSVVASESDLIDRNGFGTIVGSIVAAIAPDAVLLPVKILGKDGQGTTSEILEGVLLALEQGASIILLPIGQSGPSPALGDAMDAARDAGVLVVAPAGNSGAAELNYPAAIESVLAVGATDRKDRRTNYTNFGPWVELYAPGDGIAGLDVGGSQTARSGTSLASAVVAGIAALVLSSAPILRPDKVGDILIETADDLSDAEGKGGALRRVNALEALKHARSLTPP